MISSEAPPIAITLTSRQLRATGEGHVVDDAMSDGGARLMAMFHDLKRMGFWRDARGENVLDGAAPFYGAYECSDGKHATIGSIEPRFDGLLLETLGLTDDPPFTAPLDVARRPEMKRRLADIFRTKSRAEWIAAMEGTGICFAPRLSLAEAHDHPHNQARETFITYDGVLQPAAAARFDGVSHHPARPAPSPGEHQDEVLADWGAPEPCAARVRGAVTFRGEPPRSARRAASALQRSPPQHKECGRKEIGAGGSHGSQTVTSLHVMRGLIWRRPPSDDGPVAQALRRPARPQPFRKGGLIATPRRSRSSLDFEFVFESIDFIWLRIVSIETERCSAIVALDDPTNICAQTSISARVSP